MQQGPRTAWLDWWAGPAEQFAERAENSFEDLSGDQFGEMFAERVALAFPERWRGVVFVRAFGALAWCPVV